MPYQVAIDARMLSSGIGTYVLNLIKSLKDCCDGPNIRALTSTKDVERMRALCDEVRVVHAPIYTVREQFEIPRAARGADLLHVPHYNAPLLYWGKLLVTIHDLIHITDATFRRTAASMVYARPMFSLVTRRADHIISVSEFTKSQLLERLRVPAPKITVIRSGVSSHFCLRGREEAKSRIYSQHGLKRPYVLFVGNLKPHKNLKTLIRAFSQMCARRDFDYQLVILGDDRKWKVGLVNECAKLGINDRVLFVPQVPYEDLPCLYGAAEILTMPSFIEGFGLPVLEAMACGTPVVCSRTASLPEVAGDAAEYFEPTSADDLAAALERVLGSRELQETLRRKGLERVKLFSWHECARRTLELYSKLLQE